MRLRSSSNAGRTARSLFCSFEREKAAYQLRRHPRNLRLLLLPSLCTPRSIKHLNMCDDAFSLPPTPSTIPLQISLRAREAEAASPSSPSTHEPAIDLSHHLSKLAKNRMQSPLKGALLNCFGDDRDDRDDGRMMSDQDGGGYRGHGGASAQAGRYEEGCARRVELL